MKMWEKYDIANKKASSYNLKNFCNLMDPNWTKRIPMDRIGTQLIPIDPNGPQWIPIDHNGSKLIQMDSN